MNYKDRFNPDSVTDQELLDELLALSKKIGHVPSRKDMKNGTPITKRLYLYGRRFGGLTEACEIAGLVPNKGGDDLKYTDKELLDHIVDLKSKLRRSPKQSDIISANKYGIGAYKRHFGTYNNALKILKIRHNVRYDFTEQDIINDVIKVANTLKRSPTSAEFYNMSNTVSNTAACTKTGCKDKWNDLLRKCNLEIINNRNVTDEELKDEIIRLKEELKRVPGYHDMAQFGKYSPQGTYARKFGTYLGALKHFGFKYIPRSQYKQQTYTLGNDGFLYKSKFEASISDLIFDLKNNDKVVSYAYEANVCKERTWTCDFKIITSDNKIIWIEADGMGKNRKNPYLFDNKKIQYYIDNGFNYCIIPYKRDIKTIIDNAILNNKMYTKEDIMFEENCKARVKQWTGSKTLIFPETNNISTSLSCNINDILVWKQHKLDANYLKSVNEDVRDEIAKDIFNFFCKYDFTKLNYSEKIIKKDYDRMMNKDLQLEIIDGDKYISNINADGNTFCKKFTPNILKIAEKSKDSVFDVISDKDRLFRIIRNRVGNTFLYPHKKGGERRQFPFNITPAMIIQGSRSTGLAAMGSVFKPLVAKAIYKHFVPENGIVYDFSAGFGGRLLGAYAANKNIVYHAVEPNTETYKNLINLSDYLNFNAKIENIGSEDYYSDIKVDFIFSSPPYFDSEIYCNESTQSCNKHPNYNVWLEKYWRRTVKNIFKMCKKESIFGINVGNFSNSKMEKIYNDMTAIIIEEGFILTDQWFMKTARSHFSKSNKDTLKKEPINFYKIKY